MRSIIRIAFFLLVLPLAICAQSDARLRNVTERDRAARTPGGMTALSAAEHAERGEVYFENRHFAEAREHFQKILDLYPNDPLIPRALFVMGRSYMWERECGQAIPFFERAAREFPGTKDGRESLAFGGACHVRIGKNAEAAKVYEQYTVMYPEGERIESAYLNIIDALRESQQYDQAAQWVEKARTAFPGTPTEANALQARVRMEIFRGRWPEAISAANVLLSAGKFSRSMTSMDEAKYLKAFALEKAGRSSEANAVYASIPNTAASYFGSLAAERLRTKPGIKRTAQTTARLAGDFPAPYRAEILQYSRQNGIDPRFVLAIMKQESSFRPAVKSPSAARGLLQLTIDTARKYNKKAGFEAIEADDLYDPRTNIAIAAAYLADLKAQFAGLYEAIAASYNGGEDNAARWLARTKPAEPGIFTSEVGFAETKNYVFKVMNNYRVYRDLYDENLNRK